MIRTSIYSIFIALAFFTASCKKSNSDIGRDILPEGDILGATYCDTATVICYTVTDDSLRTDESYIGNISNLIGTIADPVFGRTDASIYVNLSNPNNRIGIGFGSEPKLDSVVLSLAYEKNAWYGDKDDALNFNVYRLTESIYYDSAYYSYSRIAHDSLNDLTYFGTGKTSKIDAVTDTYDGDDKKAPHLRIRLKNEVGQEFMDDTSKLANTTALRNAFKGLCITTKHTAVGSNDFGVIGYFDLTNPLSRLTIYYHKGTNLATATTLDLSLYGTTRFNHYDYDRTNIDPAYAQQLNGNTSTGATNVFIQGMGNSKIKIVFPYLKHFSDSGKIAVNRAEVVFKVDKSSTYYNSNKYFVPGRMALEGLYDNGTLFPLSIDQNSNLSGNWGFYDSNNSQFSFPIGFSAQKIANGDYTNLNYSMRLFQHQANPARVVLGGKNNAAYPAKLKLWYTRID
ncbi:MAG: hypothetical protein K0S33_2292 [Bacteroidetes bacterium]|nr:hypothetical protein [Bacteroidota bacterium]